MLDHLDDPAPPALGATLYRRVVRDARRRRLRSRAAATGAGLTICAGATAVFLRAQADQLERIRVDGLTPPASAGPSPSNPGIAPVSAPTSPASTTPPAAPLAGPVNVLLVGVDTPPGDTTPRGDVIAVVRIDPVTRQVGVLSIPRDLHVEAPEGPTGRLATLGSDPSELTRAIHGLGIELQHYIEIDYPGFVELIDIAGGIAVPFDRPMRDLRTGFRVDTPGCHVLDGREALAYARSRFVEVLDEGVWHRDETSDFGRVARQQDLMARLYRQVLTSGYDALAEVRLLTDIADDLTVDAGLDIGGLRQLFATARAIGPDNFHTYDLADAVHASTVAGASVLAADATAVAEAVSAFLSGVPPVPAESSIADVVVTPPAHGCP